MSLPISGVDHGSLIVGKPLPRGVSYLGALTRAEVQVLVAGLCAAVLPSRMDNLPNTAVECRFLGAPVVTTQLSSVDVLIKTDVNGRVVLQYNVEELADAMHAKRLAASGE